MLDRTHGGLTAEAGRYLSGLRAEDFADPLQDGVARDERRRPVRDQPLPANHALRVDQEEGATGGDPVLAEHPVPADHLEIREVAEQRVG